METWNASCHICLNGNLWYILLKHQTEKGRLNSCFSMFGRPFFNGYLRLFRNNGGLFSTMITVGSLNKICRPCSFTQDVSAATRDRLDLKRAETTQLTAVVWTRGWRWKRCSPQRAKTQWECHGMPIKLAKSKGMVLFCWQQLLKEVKFWKQTSLRKQLNSEFVVFAQLVIPQFRMFSRRKCLYDFNRWMSISMPHRGGWFGRGCVSSSKLFAWSPKTYNLILRSLRDYHQEYACRMCEEKTTPI